MRSSYRKFWRQVKEDSDRNSKIIVTQNSIRIFRKKKKLSQEALGALVGRDLRTISGYELGDTVPPEMQRLLATKLSTTVEELMKPASEHYPTTPMTPLELKDELTPRWIEFVEWLTAELPMPTLKKKADAAFLERMDDFEDWTKILMRRRRDREQKETDQREPE